MQKKIKLKIVTPEKLILEELVDEVSIPTTEGEITILPNHIPLISKISSGDIVALNKGEIVPMAVVGGLLEVKRENEETIITILADFAEHVSSISEEEIEKAKQRAEELRKQRENKEVVDFEYFAGELERNLTRIKIADKWKTKKYRK